MTITLRDLLGTCNISIVHRLQLETVHIRPQQSHISQRQSHNRKSPSSRPAPLRTRNSFFQSSKLLPRLHSPNPHSLTDERTCAAVTDLGCKRTRIKGFLSLFRGRVAANVCATLATHGIFISGRKPVVQLEGSLAAISGFLAVQLDAMPTASTANLWTPFSRLTNCSLVFDDLVAA